MDMRRDMRRMEGAMNPLQSSAIYILTMAQIIELLGGLIIAGYVVAALGALLRYRPSGIERARHLIATGAIAGLNLKVAATLLKTLELHTWSQLGIFAAIFALRVLLKQVFAAEGHDVRAAAEASAHIASSSSAATSGDQAPSTST